MIWESLTDVYFAGVSIYHSIFTLETKVFKEDFREQHICPLVYSGISNYTGKSWNRGCDQ